MVEVATEEDSAAVAVSVDAATEVVEAVTAVVEDVVEALLIKNIDSKTIVFWVRSVLPHFKKVFSGRMLSDFYSSIELAP